MAIAGGGRGSRKGRVAGGDLSEEERAFLIEFRGGVKATLRETRRMILEAFRVYRKQAGPRGQLDLVCRIIRDQIGITQKEVLGAVDDEGVEESIFSSHSGPSRANVHSTP